MSPHREASAAFTATIHLVGGDGQKIPTVRSSCFLGKVTNVFSVKMETVSVLVTEIIPRRVAHRVVDHHSVGVVVA